MNPNKLKKLLQNELKARSQESIPRAGIWELPKDCRGCGRCCMPHPLVEITEEQYQHHMKYGNEVEKHRGMTVKNIQHNNGEVLHWICTPPCRYLNELNECMIYGLENRPKACADDKWGSDTCRYMYHINRP